MRQRRWQLFSLVVAIGGAMAIGMAIRLQWLAVASGMPAMQSEGNVQPTTPDALWHATSMYHHGVEAMPHIRWVPQLPDLDGLIHLIGVWAVRLFDVPVDVVILWGPIWLSGLLAIPLVLIGRELGSIALGFAAAVLSLAAPAFFERTMAGSWDHDMLAIAAISTIVWAGMVASRQHRTVSMMAVGILIFLFPFVYARGLTVLAAIVGTMVVVDLIRHRGSAPSWRLATILLLAAALSPLSMGHWMGAHLVLWSGILCALSITIMVLAHPKTPMVLVSMCIPVGVLVGLLVLPWNVVAAQLELYLGIGHASELSTALAALNHDLAHGQSIQEMQRPSMRLLGQQISGWWPLTLVGVGGWVAASIQDRRLWMLTPLVLFGLFSMIAGVRFTVWAVVPVSIGVAWCIRWVCGASVLPTCFNHPVLKPILTTALFLTAVLPALASDFSYPARTVLLQSEINVLKQIGNQSKSEDVVVTWWDWGTAASYYAHRHALIHPGRMTDDVFIISRMLSSDSPLEMATFGKAVGKSMDQGSQPAVHRLLQAVGGDGGLPDIQVMVDAAKAGQLDIAGESSRSVWVYLPIETAAYLDQIAAYATQVPAIGTFRTVLAEGLVKEPDGRWRLSELDLLVDPHGGHVSIELPDGREQAIRPVSISVVTIDEYGRTHAPTRPGSEGLNLELTESGDLRTSSGEPSQWSLHLILLPQARTMLLLNDAAMRTNAVQMGVLGRYDEALFEEVSVAPRARGFRVK